MSRYGVDLDRGGLDLRAFWGKAGRAKRDERTIPHPLVCHLIDTAVVAELLFDVIVGPVCRAELELAFGPVGDCRSWTAFMCGLHDLGKLSPAFQAVRADVALCLLGGRAARDIRRVVSSQVTARRTDTPHGDLTAMHVDRMLAGWGAPRGTAQVISDALGGHHGVFADAETRSQAVDAIQHHGGRVWERWVDVMAEMVAATLGLPPPRTRPWGHVRLAPAGAVALAGLTVVSDWLASGMVVPRDYAGVDVDLSAYAELTRQRAVELVDGLQLRGWRPPHDTSFQGLFGSVEGPRPIQNLVEQIADSVSGPAIVVIEAPTGEGKTKAALQYVATVIRRFGLSGFYLAMPTRATSNQAFAEVSDVLDAQVPVKLLHGGAADFLSADRRRRRGVDVDAINPLGVGVDGPAGDQDGMARDWFTRRRGLVAPVAVGTVDRLEQVGIRSWFVTLPLVGLSNRVVIVDEVHSYDTFMSTVLDRVVWWLGRLGVPVVLLSATLATVRRDELIRSWQAGALRCRPDEVAERCRPDGDASTPQTQATGYPRVMWADASGCQTRSCEASRLNRARTVRLRRIDDDDMVDEVMGWAAAGGSVAVIRDTVRRARAAREAFTRRIAALPVADRPEMLFLIGGLAERLEVEQRLLALFGRSAARPPRAIVVGTSVLGLSLDLDFDAMVSDIAPIDSLIQRVGRLHRFRVADQPPLLAIGGIVDDAAGPVIAPGIRSVYRDWVLLRTWALLRDRTELRLPDEVPTLVDAVYGEPDAVQCPPRWAARVNKAASAWTRVAALDRMKARTIYLPPPRRDSESAFLRELTFHPKSTSQTRKPDGRTGSR